VLVFGVTACYFGLRWGLVGVAWAVVCTNILHALLMYLAVYRTIRTRVVELFRALAPALLLSGLLVAALAALDSQIVDLGTSAPLLYLAAMGTFGSLVYGLAFLFLPIPTLQSEAARWRRIISSGYGAFRWRGK
jgi:Na+-driven multidrug efflux pump